MGRVALSGEEGRRLDLPDDRVAQQHDVAGRPARQRGWDELTAFEGRLRRERGLAASTAQTYRRQLQAAVAAAGLPSPSAFVQVPDRVVAAIACLATHDARLKLHLAIQYFLEMNAETLPPDTAAWCGVALDGFPARVAPKPHLVDRELGGSVKRVRPAPPFTAGDAERLFRIVEETAPAARRARDGALVALNCWSGFAPGYFVELRWEMVLPAFTSDEDFARVPISKSNRTYPIVVDRRAVTALESYWRASGEPGRGAIFRQANRSRRPTTVPHMSRVVAGYLATAGLGGVDRRRLNAPFALALLDRGWDAKTLADAFGYRRAGTLWDHVRPVEEARAQRQSVEWLTTEAGDSGSSAADSGSSSDTDLSSGMVGTISSAGD